MNLNLYFEKRRICQLTGKGKTKIDRVIKGIPVLTKQDLFFKMLRFLSFHLHKD